MGYQTIIYQAGETSASIFLNRPEAMNAINAAMVSELEEALMDAAGRPLLRALVLSGKGRAFCVGADLKFVLGELMGRESLREGFLSDVKRMMGRLADFPAPVIAAVNGPALAGGLELLLCCDMLVAAESAVFGDAHSNYGLLPGGGSSVRLPVRVGLNRAKELLFLGESRSAAEMERWGLVNRVVPDGELGEEVARILGQLEGKSPLVLRTMKSLVNRARTMAEEDALCMEIDALDRHRLSEDMQEGLRAFREKRAPVFRGR
jgi:enoyl-CoA hydratase/carnithine racemase